jgi:hypothetical protein
MRISAIISSAIFVVSAVKRFTGSALRLSVSFPSNSISITGMIQETFLFFNRAGWLGGNAVYWKNRQKPFFCASEQEPEARENSRISADYNPLNPR